MLAHIISFPHVLVCPFSISKYPYSILNIWTTKRPVTMTLPVDIYSDVGHTLYPCTDEGPQIKCLHYWLWICYGLTGVLLLQTFPLFLDPLPMAILFCLLTPVPWNSHLRIQIFIQTHFFPLVLDCGIVYLQILVLFLPYLLLNVLLYNCFSFVFCLCRLSY